MDQSTEKLVLRELKTMVLEKAYRTGQFTLASGKTSDFYLDMRPVLLHPEGAETIARLAVNALCKASYVHPDELALAGVPMAGLTLASSISLIAHLAGIYEDFPELGSYQWPLLLVRQEPKAHGTGKLVEGVENVSSKTPIILCEDVTTSGASALKVATRLREAGLNPVAVLTVVDREEGAREALGKADLAFLPLLTLAELRE